MNISRTIIIPVATASAPMIGPGRWRASGVPAGRRVAGAAVSLGLHAAIAVAIVAVGVRAVDHPEPSAVEMVFDPAQAIATTPIVAASIPDAAANAPPVAPPPELRAVPPEMSVPPPPAVEVPPVSETIAPAAVTPPALPPSEVPPVTMAPPDLAAPVTPVRPTASRPTPAIGHPARPAPAHKATARPHVAEPAPGTQAGPAAAEPAPPNATPAPPPAAPAPQTGAIDPGWRSAVGSWLAAHRRYPEAARTRGQEGVVGVAFTADRDGRVLGVTITRSSGTPLLDQSVRDMLTGQRVPAFPADMRQSEAVLSVAVRFTLEP
jgi:protein TonB